jgi:hypothetical protein
MAQGKGLDAAIAPLKAHHREIAGAAAEIGDQDRRVMAQLARIEEGGTDRLVDIMTALDAEPAESRMIAPHRQSLVGTGACETHRTADHDLLRRNGERAVGMAQKTAQEDREQVFEAEVLAEYPRLHERGTGGEGLEGLDEAMRRRTLDELLDRPGISFHAQICALALMLLPEAQSRIIGAMDDAVWVN